MINHLTDRTLQLHLDGDLPTAARWEAESHMGSCAACRARYEELEMLVGAVKAIEPEIDPPSDLWLGIAARIAAPAGPAGAVSRAPRPPNAVGRLWIGWIAAAAAMLILGIGLGRRMPQPSVPNAANHPAAASSSALFATYEDAAYDEAISELQAILSARRDELRPETVAAIEENLAIIDAAIADARAALADDPANEYLHRHLSGYMLTKLQILRSVTTAVTAQI